jgi:hypothetical protein
MSMHPEIMRIMAAEHVKVLQHDAARPVRPTRRRPAADTRDVELRLCRVSDDPELERLAELEGREVPAGRLVIAAIRGCIVAALPVAGGRAIADPFTRTAHIVPLLELRAAQLREPELRRGLLPRYVGLIRGSSQA